MTTCLLRCSGSVVSFSSELIPNLDCLSLIDVLSFRDEKRRVCTAEIKEHGAAFLIYVFVCKYNAILIYISGSTLPYPSGWIRYFFLNVFPGSHPPGSLLHFFFFLIFFIGDY